MKANTNKIEAPGWGLVMLADEPATLVMANLCWHLEHGAQEIHLFLDAPDSAAARAIGKVASMLPGVVVTRCDAAFWQDLNGARPALQTRRQTLIATQAYRRTKADWLLHLDADEFLWLPPGHRFVQELEALGDLPGYLALPNLERAYTTAPPERLFEGAFRIPIPAKAPMPEALAHQAPFVARGVSGHAAGKACARAGLEAMIQPHAPRLNGAALPSAPAAKALVLHFDGLTPLHWLIKLRRYAAHDPVQWERFLAPHRRAQLAYVRAHQGNASALRALHDRLKVIEDLPGLEAAGLAQHRPFDPSPALRRWLGHVPDLGVAAFDAALRATFPHLAVGL